MMMNAFSDHRQRCLRLLQERRASGTGIGADTREICATGVGGEEGTRRVRELRELGYPIRQRKLPNGYWYYWLGEANTGQQDLFAEA